jgi:hypothetical protein
MADDLQITFVLRPPEASKAIGEQLLAGTYDPTTTSAADISANPSDVKAVTDFAASHNLRVVSVEPEKRTVRVAGPAGAIEKALGISSANAGTGSVQSLDYKGPVNLRAPLDGVVIAVLGLDNTAIARPHTV